MECIVLFKRFNLSLAYFGALMIVVMMLTTALNVVLRYVFSNPLAWPLEVSEYMLVACAFLPACYTLLEKGHISVDLIYLRFSPKRRVWMDIVTYIMGLLYSSALMWQSGILALRSYQKNWLSEAGSEIPLWPSYATVPIGSFLLCVGFVALFMQSVKQLRTPDTKRENNE